MKVIQDKFKLKGYKIDESDVYLDAYFSKTTNLDGQEFWAVSYDKYCTASVTNM